MADEDRKTVVIQNDVYRMECAFKPPPPVNPMFKGLVFAVLVTLLGMVAWGMVLLAVWGLS
jgi:hypothetical protein